MKNFEKYKTSKERADALGEFCKSRQCDKCEIGFAFKFCGCHFAWLDLEAEEDNLLPCPFCGGKTGTNLGQLLSGEVSHWVDCLNPKCMYKSANCTSKKDAIDAHNRICKAASKYDEKGEPKSKEEYALFVQPFKGSPWCVDSNTDHSLEDARRIAQGMAELGHYRIQIKKRNVTEWALVEEVKK